MAGNFSFKIKRIYLDYAATTPVDPLVEKAMRPYFTEKFGNPGSLHFFGQSAMAAVDEAREKIAKAIGADFREIIFTGSATEANNLALRGAVRATNLFSTGTGRSSAPAAEAALGLSPSRLFASQKDQARLGSETFRTKTSKSPYRIIISAVEHESILETARNLEREGIEVIYLPVDRRGFVDLKKMEKSLNERTVLVSVMYANNEIGTIQPIAEIAKIIQEFRRQNLEFMDKHTPKSYILNSIAYPLFHTDAAQAFQYLNCDVNKLGVDLMTLSGHKIYGPKGIGVLYVKKNPQPTTYNLQPLITGGGQEFGFRSGTENVPLIVGFAKAVELVIKGRKKETGRIKILCDYFWQGLKKIVPRAAVNGSFKNRLPNNLNVWLPGYSAEDLLVRLDLAGIAVSSGSACSARSVEPSHVLRSIGCGEKRIKQSLRFTLGKFIHKSELDEALKRIKNITNAR